MLIKMFNKSGNVIVQNIKVEEYTPWYVDGKRIIFQKKSEIENDASLTFSTEEDATEAFDRIFETYGSSAPIDKTLDLTRSREEIEAEAEEGNTAEIEVETKEEVKVEE